MIKALRWKFIRITMFAVLVVLLLIFFTVNAVNIYRNNNSLDSVTEIILESGGSFRKNQGEIDKFKPDGVDPSLKFNDPFHNREELPFSTRFFTVVTDEEGNVIRYDLSSIASVYAGDIENFTEKILKKNKTVGWYDTYRYRVGETSEGKMLIVMDAMSVRASITSVLFITLFVGVVAFIAVFVLVALFSKRAIKPISETYEKQRQFITDASHELKTPLTVISANAEILSLTYGENEWCDGIERQTASLRDLIGQMIQMSRLDEGESTMTFERFDLSDAVYDTAMTFSAFAERKGVRFTVSVEPELHMNGDEGSIRQVVSILTDNAIKYCDDGGEISVTAKTAREAGRGHIYVSVSNSYSSVDTLDTEKIFERFYREDKSRSSAHSYGLGLSIARAIVEKHGGKLQAVKGKQSLEMIMLI